MITFDLLGFLPDIADKFASELMDAARESQQLLQNGVIVNVIHSCAKSESGRIAIVRVYFDNPQVVPYAKALLDSFFKKRDLGFAGGPPRRQYVNLC